jgi:hypothetical protein
MANWHVTAGLVGIGVVGIGALMVWSNPTPSTFESFALEQVKLRLCPQVPLGFDRQCPQFVDTNQATLKGWVRTSTQHQNYGILTYYETTLSPRDLVPEPMRPALALMPLPQSYRLQTIGILGHFIVYNAESQR